MAELNYGSIVGVFSSDGRLRLDIGTWGVKKNIPANHDSWATRLVICKLDGTGAGTPVRYGDLIGISARMENFDWISGSTQ